MAITDMQQIEDALGMCQFCGRLVQAKSLGIFSCLRARIVIDQKKQSKNVIAMTTTATLTRTMCLKNRGNSFVTFSYESKKQNMALHFFNDL